ncbi:Zinc finger, RING-type, conserved site [Phytophthora cactorum]|nr:Zinc finger, RING-type, conserved site [Phytophthora cactorum]
MDDDSRMSETSSVRNRGQRHASSLAGDLDAAGDAASLSASHIRPQLRCNACWEPILPDVQSAETCYRTSCGHLFCEKCAYKHFGQGRLQCPACSIDLSQARGGISETTIHGVANSKFQLAQDSFRKRSGANKHGEKYIQLKNYTDQLEAELRETKSKMQALTTSNDELREAYKEKSRKCRNWEKMCKTLKAQPSTRQFPSPTRSTMGGIGMQHQDGGALVTQASQFQPSFNEANGEALRGRCIYSVDEELDDKHGKTGDPTDNSETECWHVRSLCETSDWPTFRKNLFSMHEVAQFAVSIENTPLMTKPIFSPGSAIQRAKPLFELSAAGGEIDYKRVKKPPTRMNPPATLGSAIPFDSETIFEARDCSPGMCLGSSGSQVDLTLLSLELADVKDLCTESTCTSIDGGHPEHGTEQLSRLKSQEATNSSIDSLLSSTPSRSLVSLTPLKAPPQISKLLELESQRRRKVEELARIYKREKVAEVQGHKSSELMSQATYSCSMK